MTRLQGMGQAMARLHQLKSKADVTLEYKQIQKANEKEIEMQGGKKERHADEKKSITAKQLFLLQKQLHDSHKKLENVSNVGFCRMQTDSFEQTAQGLFGRFKFAQEDRGEPGEAPNEDKAVDRGQRRGAFDPAALAGLREKRGSKK